MEVNFTPGVQAKLEQLARESGRSCHDFDELSNAREVLVRRYDDLESGRVTPIDGEEAYRRLMEKTEAQRRCNA